MVLRKSFYIRWSAGRSPRVHEVNPGRDPSNGVRNYSSHSPLLFIQIGFHLVMDWVISSVPSVQV